MQFCKFGEVSRSCSGITSSEQRNNDVACIESFVQPRALPDITALSARRKELCNAKSSTTTVTAIVFETYVTLMNDRTQLIL